MEQNPVDVFWRSCKGKQGVAAMMRDAMKTFPDGVTIHNVNSNKKIRKNADINYGIVDISDLKDFVPSGSADFVITDPPYAGLVRYIPLSMVWLAWLEKLNARFRPDFDAEIAVGKSTQSRKAYQSRLRNAFENIYAVLKEDGRLVVTFHHQDVREFNDFVTAVKSAGFVFDKVTHQYNRRSGESNVANPYGVSGSDFYVRCVKHRHIDFTDNKSELERYILNTAVNIIGKRNEPTAYSFLFQSLWPELLQAGFVQPQDSRDEVNRILRKNEGPGCIFKKSANADPRLGDVWWFAEPAEHISHPDRPLKDRVDDSVLAFLRRHTAVKLDDVIANLFREYPNGLTPDPRTVGQVLEKYAFRSQGKWKIRPETEAKATRHSDTIATVLSIGQKLGLRRFVGLREQPEYTSSNQRLREMADVTNLSGLVGDIVQESLQRLEMVDAIFLPKTPAVGILCLWEIENSTNFTSAIQRGSNAPAETSKIMVVPDERESELRRTIDPLFKLSFRSNNWRYMTYTDLSRVAGFKTKNFADVIDATREL